METTTPPPPTTLSNPHQPHSTGSHRQPSPREDWWSEDATATLLQAWGHRFLRLNFGNLRQNDWKEVADTVNSSHGNGRRPKTDAQCRSRIDTLKKKYKAEKAKLSPSTWRFFDHLDVLIGPVSKKPAGEVVKSESLRPYLSLTGAKYRESSLEDDGNEEEEAGDWGFVPRKHPRVEEGDLSEEESECKGLARAIVKLGEVYERVEVRKQEKMVELEMQRMEVVKELELQRMNMLMEMQLELEKSKKRKRGDGSGK